MKKLLLIIPVIALAACETQEQRMITGAATGAALGAAVSSGDDRARGALIGGAAGLAAGTLIGRVQNNPNQCLYRRADGSTFTAAC